MKKVDVPFSEVLSGSEFESLQTKRHFWGVKLEKMFVQIPAKDLPRTRRVTGRYNSPVIFESQIRNAAITIFPDGSRPDDAGKLTYMSDKMIVRVYESAVAKKQPTKK